MRDSDFLALHATPEELAAFRAAVEARRAKDGTTGWRTMPNGSRIRADHILAGCPKCGRWFWVAPSSVPGPCQLCNWRGLAGGGMLRLATADEETGSARGLVPLLKKNVVRPSFALILDADAFNIITAQKGLIHFRIGVAGRKAHGAYPYQGVNAIDQALVLIQILEGLRWRELRHRLLKPPTVNIGTIRGGDKVNMVADWCVVEVDLRFLPGMSAVRIRTRIRAAFDKTKVRYKIEVDDIQRPYEIDGRHPLVSCLRRAARGVGAPAPIRGSEGATVITFFQDKGIPAVATGYGSPGNAHATDEFVRVRDLVCGAAVLERFIRLFDKKRP